MNITISPLTQNNHVCGFLFNSSEIDSLQQFKEAILNDEATINYSRADKNLLIVINGKKIQCPTLSNTRHKKLHGFLQNQPALYVAETGEETSFVLIGDTYREEETTTTLFSSTIEIMLEEQIAA
jgi:hypothetical protein